MQNPSTPTSVDERIAGVYRVQLERMLELMATRIPTVMAAHRYAEEHARIYNRIGRNNLTEVLSHLAGLAEERREARARPNSATN